eukprot:SAG31_NODE_1153_length_9640_cov_2.830206_4_plen_243_part_00
MNESYLDAIELVVSTLASEGIYTIIDAHQDCLGRRFCGEGLPDWAVMKALDLAGINARYQYLILSHTISYYLILSHTISASTPAIHEKRFRARTDGIFMLTSSLVWAPQCLTMSHNVSKYLSKCLKMPLKMPQSVSQCLKVPLKVSLKVSQSVSQSASECLKVSRNVSECLSECLTMSHDVSGLPDLSRCQQHNFVEYYGTKLSLASWNALFRSDELWSDFAAHWQAIARRFAGNSAVLRYF